MRVVKSRLTSCLGFLPVMASNAHGMRLTDLALDPRVPKSALQRLFEHLADAGRVEQDDATRRPAKPFSPVSGSAALRGRA